MIVSALVFTIIELPPGDYFESYISELRAQGEAVDMAEIEELRAQYGFDKPPVLRYFYWVAGLVQGDYGYSFEYQLPVNEVVGDRLWLTVLVSFVTIIFTWLIAFPIGIYSATHQYSWGDYGLTFMGLIGIAIPNFMFALILMYFANIWFGTSIGHLMDQKYLSEPMSWEKAKSILEHLWIPVLIVGTAGTAGMIRRLRANLLDELQKTICRDRPRQGLAPVPHPDQISAAHGTQLLHFRYWIDPAGHHFRRRDHRHRAVARDDGTDADKSVAKSGYVSGRLVP